MIIIKNKIKTIKLKQLTKKNTHRYYCKLIIFSLLFHIIDDFYPILLLINRLKLNAEIFILIAAFYYIMIITLFY